MSTLDGDFHKALAESERLTNIDDGLIAGTVSDQTLVDALIARLASEGIETKRDHYPGSHFSGMLSIRLGADLYFEVGLYLRVPGRRDLGFAIRIISLRPNRTHTKLIRRESSAFSIGEAVRKLRAAFVRKGSS
jgi:hypothetical protein